MAAAKANPYHATRDTLLSVAATVVLLASACGSDSESAPAQNGGSAGTSGARASGGMAGNTAGKAGGSGAGPAGGAAQGGASGGGAGGFSGVGEGGSAGNTGPDLGGLVKDGVPAVTMVPRPAFGAVIAVNDGERVYAVESRRDAEPGPFGLPWRSRFRLAAYDAGVEAWAFAADPDDVVSDVAVHPSGELTVAVLHQVPDRMAYDLVRLSRDGAVLGTTTLAEPATLPASDFGPNDPDPLFRMKSDLGDATSGGWLRLLPDGEGLFAAILSHLDGPASNRLVLGLEALDWRANAYGERWARVVEGAHRAEPVAWAYDEFRWMEQAIRPFLARDSISGELLVGRAWNTTRCAANVAVFHEFTPQDCATGAVSPGENQRLPLAVTRFDRAGARRGTAILASDDDAAEQLAFVLVARGGQLAVAGSVVRELPDGSKRTYPDPSGYVDYDGYIATYASDGHLLLHRDFNLGRGDVLASLRWTADGFLAVGAAGWDRWQGGMSITRGADPLIAWLSADGTASATRVIPLSDGTRHFNLHDAVILDRSIVVEGFSDAPMTHSADGGNNAARTFGPLRITLSAP